MNELQWMKGNIFIKISLSFYSRKGNTVCCKFEREMERHILREGTSSCPISSSQSQGVPMLAPPHQPYCQRWPNASDWPHIPGLTLNSDWPLNQTAWFSYHLVSFWLPTCSTGQARHTAIPLLTNHNVKACQSTWGYQEWT